jgi:iron complex transport system substrate-binding protein
MRLPPIAGWPGSRGSARRRRAYAASAACILAALAAACGEAGSGSSSSPPGQGDGHATSPSTSSYPMTMTDDDGVEVRIDAPPERLVTWAPSNTELLFALGLGDRVVGVSGPFDDFPAEAKSIQRVGGEGGIEPSVEKVLALHPDLVLNGFLGGDEWKGRLRDLGVVVFSVYAEDLDDALNDIETVGRLTGATDAAGSLVRTLRSRAEAVRGPEEPRVSCFLEVGYPDLYTVGPLDFPFDLLERAGCDPVTEEAGSPYPLWSLEQLVEDDPEVYILTSEAGITPAEVAERPGYGSISAIEQGRVYLIDSELITRPGPRVVDGLEELARLLHREATS